MKGRFVCVHPAHLGTRIAPCVPRQSSLHPHHPAARVGVPSIVSPLKCKRDNHYGDDEPDETSGTFYKHLTHQGVDIRSTGTVIRRSEHPVELCSGARPGSMLRIGASVKERSLFRGHEGSYHSPDRVKARGACEGDSERR